MDQSDKFWEEQEKEIREAIHKGLLRPVTSCGTPAIRAAMQNNASKFIYPSANVPFNFGRNRNQLQTQVQSIRTAKGGHFCRCLRLLKGCFPKPGLPGILLHPLFEPEQQSSGILPDFSRWFMWHDCRRSDDYADGT